MYSSSAGLFAAGHGSAGVTSPSLQWFFAEGATGSFFDTFVLLANPNASAAEVTATYLQPSGQTITRDYTLQPNSRTTINVQEQSPQLDATAVSVQLASTNGVTFLAERSMWWPHGQAWIEAHNAAGATTTGIKWRCRRGSRPAARGHRDVPARGQHRRRGDHGPGHAALRDRRLDQPGLQRPGQRAVQRAGAAIRPAGQRQPTCACRAGRGSARWWRAWARRRSSSSGRCTGTPTASSGPRARTCWRRSCSDVASLSAAALSRLGPRARRAGGAAHASGAARGR